MLNWQKIASFSVHRGELGDRSVETWSEKETITWGPCTPPPTLETFSKKLARQLVPVSRYIAGLLKKEKMKKMKKKITGDREIAYGQILAWRMEPRRRVVGNVVLDEVLFVILGVFSKHT